MKLKIVSAADFVHLLGDWIVAVEEEYSHKFVIVDGELILGDFRYHDKLLLCGMYGPVPELARLGEEEFVLSSDSRRFNPMFFRDRFSGAGIVGHSGTVTSWSSETLGIDTPDEIREQVQALIRLALASA